MSDVTVETRAEPRAAFFHDGAIVAGTQIVLTETEARHIAVLRIGVVSDAAPSPSAAARRNGLLDTPSTSKQKPRHEHYPAAIGDRHAERLLGATPR